MSEYDEDMAIVSRIVTDIVGGTISVRVADYLPDPELAGKQWSLEQLRAYWTAQRKTRDRRARISKEVKNALRYRHGVMTRHAQGKLLVVPTEHVNTQVAAVASQKLRSAASTLKAGFDYKGFTLNNVASSIIADLERHLDLLSPME